MARVRVWGTIMRIRRFAGAIPDYRPRGGQRLLPRVDKHAHVEGDLQAQSRLPLPGGLGDRRL